MQMIGIVHYTAVLLAAGYDPGTRLIRRAANCYLLYKLRACSIHGWGWTMRYAATNTGALLLRRGSMPDPLAMLQLSIPVPPTVVRDDLRQVLVQQG